MPSTMSVFRVVPLLSVTAVTYPQITDSGLAQVHASVAHAKSVKIDVQSHMGEVSRALNALCRARGLTIVDRGDADLTITVDKIVASEERGEYGLPAQIAHTRYPLVNKRVVTGFGMWGR